MMSDLVDRVGVFIVAFILTGGANLWAANSADVVARLQKTPEAQRQSLLEEEAKKKAHFLSTAPCRRIIPAACWRRFALVIRS
jgi:hypothetical protein